MSARGVRIVVGEGPSTRRGLLRFVLDGEGYDVVAEASTTAALARLMAVHRPDVVVLDDGIGATTVGMINEMSPNTKVVLVWPGAVMPIGGAARVEPARVLQDLGPTIARLTGQPGAAAGRGAALLDRAIHEPFMLDAMLSDGLSAIDGPIIEDREPAPVVILPLTPTIDHSELILNVPDAETGADDEPDDRKGAPSIAAGASAVAAGAAVLAGSTPAAARSATGTAAATSLAARRSAIGAQSVLNRRLGNLALGGAAVASALVLALALGTARVPVQVISGSPTPISPTPSETVSPGDPTAPVPEAGSNQPSSPGNAPGDGNVAAFPVLNLVSSTSPEPPGPPDVVVDPGDLGPGGNDGPPPDGGGGGDDDDHSGGDSGDHDRGGGNDDPDNPSGGSDGGDDDGSDDHDSGGGNDDDDGDDHDNGGGNDDPDNPAHDQGNGDDPEGGGDGEAPSNDHAGGGEGSS